MSPALVTPYRPLLVALGAVALSTLAGLASADDASARPRYRADHQWEREPELLGYRVSVEPILRQYRCGRGERCPGGEVLATELVVWKLRVVLRGPGGEEIEARFNERGRDAVVRDREIKVNRWWRRGDVPAQTRILRDPDTALAAFLDWSRSDDPRTLDPRLDDRPHRPDHRPPPIHDPYEPNPPPGRPPRGDSPGRPARYGLCEQALLDRGHHPSHLEQCAGVEERCAVTLLEKGHHPTHLQGCREVEPFCAVKLLEKGHHPTHLAACRRALSPGCVDALLEKGHHPSHLEHCARVDDRCAINVLERGHHPSQLSGCRR